ncbi:PhzF family phenazine biosynthesis protein [Anoxybacterium hadale]|uniref:PhzF family phenazine biosynthesis protein n=1 Tax=Anoxybacterium hadale TaxID=3408580 RepID=A0ACD1AGA8_9FIRM|nr:PhzF family phenazine biosynthesis protein [Clostridiales bacterium]
MKFYIVDAFADTLFGGNPAGVVILDDGMDFPHSEQMRKTAAELRYSETAFIKPMGHNQFQIRYFTPASEVDLCGHATIGSFVALADAGLTAPGTDCICCTLAGDLNIQVSDGSVLMDMSAPEAIGEIADNMEQKELYEIMGIRPKHQGEILFEGQLIPESKRLSEGKTGRLLIPEIISTGLPDILLPVENEAALASIAPDFSALSRLSERYGVVGVHAFTVNSEDGAVHCRNFAPLYDIDEEAATGTSNGALTYYLYKNGLISENAVVRYIQGEAMARPSVITGRLSLVDGAVNIQVGGSAVILVRGTIDL